MKKKKTIGIVITAMSLIVVVGGLLILRRKRLKATPQQKMIDVKKDLNRVALQEKNPDKLTQDKMGAIKKNVQSMIKE